jgi:hypothetical protein
MLAGCQGLSNDLTVTAAQFPTEGKPFDRIDIVNAIDPEDRRVKLNVYCARTDSAKSKEAKEADATDLQCALAAFETYWMTYIEFEEYLRQFGPPISSPEKSPKQSPVTDTQTARSYNKTLLPQLLPEGLMDEVSKKKADSYALAMRRNELQDSIIRHSDDYCRRFQAHTSDVRSLFNVTAGGLTTLLGGLGSIFTDAATARALAGAAGITSGINAQYESAFFQQQALSTIFAGIGYRRERIAAQISNRRFRVLEPNAKKIKPNFTVVASLMRDGRIHESVASYSGLELASLPADENLLYVVDFGDEGAEGETTDQANDAADSPKAKEKDDPKLRQRLEDQGPVALVSVASYTLERAIGDALVYHQACSLTEGLAEAERSIESYKKLEDPATGSPIEEILENRKKYEELRKSRPPAGAPVN